jgi:L-lactate dehydrogenase complex protein LldG
VPLSALNELIKFYFEGDKRLVTTLPELVEIAEPLAIDVHPHLFQDIELAIIKAHFAVVENGAIKLDPFGNGNVFE